MNTNRLLTAVAIVALAAGTTAALAQQEPPRGAPAEKIAPKAPVGDAHQNTHTAPGASSGTAAAGTLHGGAADEGRKNAAEERGERRNVGQGPRRETSGQAPQNERNERATEGKTEGRKSEPNRSTGERRDDGRGARDNELGARRDRGARSNQDDRRGRGGGGEVRQQTTGQGAASTRGNVSVNITSEQRTRIHDIIIKERSAPHAEHVDFDLSVGTDVPRSVRIVTVPREIIEIEPEWRGFHYFLVGDQIIIVNPRSMRIVAVLDV
jgi:hypothetical protein